MWPFTHKHDWDIVEVRHGPLAQVAAGYWTQDVYWYWRCRCGRFAISVSGGQRVKIEGNLPKKLRDAGNDRIAKWLDQWLPRCKELER